MLQKIITTLKNKQYELNEKPFELNIVGVRSTKAQQNKFDDTINVFYKREDGEWIINTFAATTDPGTYWLENLKNAKGTAIVAPGQYKNSHRIGVHRNKYQALVQQNPLTIYRDANKNAVINYFVKSIEAGVYGINIHRANVSGKSISVDKHSAGCQVVADVNDFNLLMELAMRHKKLYGNNFTYTLLDEKEIQVSHE